jgi:hypothetical protein
MDWKIMIKFTTPEKLDGQLLNDELIAAGITILTQRQDGFVFPYMDGNGDLFLDIDEKDKNKAAKVVADHQKLG